MYCESCGNFIPDGQAFCSNCGARVASPAPSAPAAPAAPVQSAAPAAMPVAPVAPAPAAVQPIQTAAPQPVYQQPAYQQPAQPVYQQTIQPVYQQPVYQPVAAVNPILAKRGNGAAVAGLVFGILTVVTCWIPFIFYVFGLLGLIFSIVGVAKRNARGKGMAIAGLILSILFSVGGGFFTQYFWINFVGGEAKDLIKELETYDGYSTYSTSTKGNNEFFIDGDFVTTENGYVSGVLHIDGVRVDF